MKEMCIKQVRVKDDKVVCGTGVWQSCVKEVVCDRLHMKDVAHGRDVSACV